MLKSSYPLPLALSCALLAGCGSSSGSTGFFCRRVHLACLHCAEPGSSIPLGEDNSTDALNAPFETLLDTNPISNQFEIAAMNIEYDFNILPMSPATRASKATTTAMPASCWSSKLLTARLRMLQTLS